MTLRLYLQQVSIHSANNDLRQLECVKKATETTRFNLVQKRASPKKDRKIPIQNSERKQTITSWWDYVLNTYSWRRMN